MLLLSWAGVWECVWVCVSVCVIKTQWVNAVCSWAICFFTRSIAACASVPFAASVCLGRCRFCPVANSRRFSTEQHLVVFAQLCFSNRLRSQQPNWGAYVLATNSVWHAALTVAQCGSLLTWQWTTTRVTIITASATIAAAAASRAKWHLSAASHLSCVWQETSCAFVATTGEKQRQLRNINTQSATFPPSLLPLLLHILIHIYILATSAFMSSCASVALGSGGNNGSFTCCPKKAIAAASLFRQFAYPVECRGGIPDTSASIK